MKQSSQASSGQRIRDSHSVATGSRFGQLSRKSTFHVSSFTHIPYKLLMLTPDLPLPPGGNESALGPNGNPIIKIETADQEFYGEMKNGLKNGKGL